MIITFQSRAAGDVMMFGDVARRMMEIIGKEPADRGIVTVEDLPAAIARLRAAIAADKAARAGRGPAALPETEKVPGGGERPFVTVAQRAQPLLELFEQAAKREQPVVWGI